MPRRRRKFTKEDAIYGLWAEHDSDDERGGYVPLQVTTHSIPSSLAARVKQAGKASVGGVTVSIVAFQAVDPGSTPGQRIFLTFLSFLQHQGRIVRK